MVLLNGNQTMILMTAFLLEEWKKGKINKTICRLDHCINTYDDGIGTNYDVECKVGLTGFKWIAKMIKDFPELEFIGGGEESFDTWLVMRA
jgi:phosphomannomutase